MPDHPRCKTCHHWSAFDNGLEGICEKLTWLNGPMFPGGEIPRVAADGLVPEPEPEEIKRCFVMTGPGFGCVHHQPREEGGQDGE